MSCNWLNASRQRSSGWPQDQDINCILPQKHQNVCVSLLWIKYVLEPTDHSGGAGSKAQNPRCSHVLCPSHTAQPISQMTDHLPKHLLHVFVAFQTAGAKSAFPVSITFTVAWQKNPSLKTSGIFFRRTSFWFSRMQHWGLYLCWKPFLWYHLLPQQLYQRVMLAEIMIFPSLEVGSGCDLTFWNTRSCLWSKETCSALVPLTPTPSHTWNDKPSFERTVSTPVA